MLTYQCFLQSDVQYANIRHDPRSEYNQQKSQHIEHHWSWGVWGSSETLARVLGGGAP